MGYLAVSSHDLDTLLNYTMVIVGTSPKDRVVFFDPFQMALGVILITGWFQGCKNWMRISGATLDGFGWTPFNRRPGDHTSDMPMKNHKLEIYIEIPEIILWKSH